MQPNDKQVKDLLNINLQPEHWPKKEEPEIKKSVYIRDATAGDLPFLFNSWLRSFRNSIFCKFVDNSIYFSEHHKLIERIMKRATIKMACRPDKPEEVFGYICYEKIDGIFCLHYAYVKQTFRNLSIFKSLLSVVDHDFKTAGVFTHNTKAAGLIAEKLKLIYHPYILMNYLEKDQTVIVEIPDDKETQIKKRNAAGGQFEVVSELETGAEDV